MTHLVIAAAALLMAVIGSDLALNGVKVQTGLARALAVYGAIGLAVMLHLWFVDGTGAVAFAIYWVGAFLSWFGVRSHIESSILLRMLALLRCESKTDGQLMDEYEMSNGQAQRVEELLRSGLVARGAGGIELTSKGRLIVRAAGWLQ